LKVVLMGYPGAGKGTQAAWLTESYGIPQISSGGMLRSVARGDTPLGRRIEAILEEGGLVPDDLMISIIRERISEADCQKGFILDGYPRSIEQAEALDRILDGRIGAAIFLHIPREEAIRRLAGRLNCLSCGAVFPKGGLSACPSCGGELYHRGDDKENTVRKRLEVYEKYTAPVVEHYRSTGKLLQFNGQDEPGEVSKHIAAELEQVMAS
jgi:adenylate kinase